MKIPPPSQPPVPNTPRLIYLIILVLVLLLLAACNHMPTKPETSVDQTREIKFDASLLKECDKLPTLPSARELDVQEWAKKVIAVHTACSTSKSKENAEIKKALNLK